MLGSSSHGIKGLESGKQGENGSELVNAGILSATIALSF